MIKGEKLLIIEDEEDTFFLLRQLLTGIGYKEECIVHCDTISSLSLLDATEFALVFTDLTLPGSKPTETLPKVLRKFPHVPVIVISGNAETETSARSIQQGAQDYLVKGDFNKRTLSKSIEYALERKKSTSSYEHLFSQNPMPMYVFNKATKRILMVNNAAIYQYGYSKSEFKDLTILDIRPEEDISSLLERIALNNAAYYDAGRWRHKSKDGTVFWVHIYAHTIDIEDIEAQMIVAINIDEKVRAERERAQRTKQVENILASITDAFFTLDKANNFTYVNNEFEKIIQRNADELIGCNIWSAFPEAVPLKFYSEYEKAIQERIPVQFEEFLPSLELWLSVKAYPTVDGLAVYFIDITERKAIQNKLIIDEQNLRAIINNTRDIIWSIDRDYKIISANNAFWERVFLITGKRYDEVTANDFNKELFTMWADYFDRAFLGETFKVILEEQTEDAIAYVETSFNPITNEDNYVIGISCFSRDISEEKRLQKKIQADEHNLRAMIDNTDDAVWSIDTDMKLITANQSYQNAFFAATGQYPKTGSPVLVDEFGGDTAGEWQKIYKRGLAGERFTIEQDTKAGDETRHTETRFNPIHNIAGEVIGVSCFRRNMTEIHGHLMKIEAQNEQFRQIAWVQSHQVRSHVATILGLADIMAMQEGTSEEIKTIVEGIKTSAIALDKVINEINLLTKQLK